MLRRTTANYVVNLPYSTIIIGGGNVGCYLAHSLSMGGHRVALVESGVDLRSKPRWHHEMPCSQIAHRIHKRGYESMITTTPQMSYTGDVVGAMRVPYPNVLGGSGVMGGKAWFHGDVSDWEHLPFDFKKDVRHAIQELEGIESPLPYRGKHGKFFVSRPATTSPCYKPFSEAMIGKKEAYIINYNLETGKVPCGVGRPEVLIDKRKQLAHSTLRSHLLEATNLRRDVTVFAETTAMALNGKGGNVHGVSVVGKDGKAFTLEGRRVILAGNAVNNAQLFLKSVDFAEQATTIPVGKNFYDRPSVVIQYKSNIRDTHQMFDTALTRVLALADWQWRGLGNAVTSGYDDIVCYWNPNDKTDVPSVKISFQPFAMDNTGAFNTDADHAVQFVIELLTPSSRGVVTADSVDPNYYGDADGKDKALMAKAVEFVKSIATSAQFKPYLGGEAALPMAELHQGTGASGGTFSLGDVVDGDTFAVKGCEGLYVCDASIMPAPMTGAPIATSLATSSIFSDRLLDKAAVKAKETEEAEEKARKQRHHPGTVGGKDEDRQYSNTVKVTYY